MRRLMNLLLGTVTIRASGLFPERLINLCAQQGVEFWGLEHLDQHTVELTLRRGWLADVDRLAQKAGCQLEERGRRGLPDALLRFRRRYAFLVGLVFSLCAVGFLSRFVLTIQVSGNQKVPTAQILSQLRRQGVRLGAYGPALDRKQLAQEALLELDGLSWMAINLHGTRLEVVVREVVEKPDRIDERGFYDIVAETDGQIVHLEAELGDAAVQEGQLVAAGDRLILGTVTMEPPVYSDQPARYYQVHARGRVWARTWRTLSASIPLEVQVKDYTGAGQERWYLDLPGRRIKIFGRSSISGDKCDKMTLIYRAPLPGGGALPLALVRERLRPYSTHTVQVDQAAARSLLEQQLLRQLEDAIGADGKVEDRQAAAAVEGGLLKVTIQAQCLEEIGREAPGAPIGENGPGAPPGP